jgi:hypothetical protein
MPAGGGGIPESSTVHGPYVMTGDAVVVVVVDVFVDLVAEGFVVVVDVVVAVESCAAAPAMSLMLFRKRK